MIYLERRTLGRCGGGCALCLGKDTANAVPKKEKKEIAASVSGRIRPS